jgi:hypothetical protein
VARQVGVPGVGMHEVGGCHCGGHRQVSRDRPQCLVRIVEPVPGLVSNSTRSVRSLAVDRQVHQAGKLAGEVADVHARAAVHLGRVLAREQGHPQPPGAGGHAVTT